MVPTGIVVVAVLYALPQVWAIGKAVTSNIFKGSRLVAI